MGAAERISDLIFKYLRDELLPEEAEELDQWIYSAPENEAIFLRLTDEDELRYQLQLLYESREQTWKKLQEKVPELAPPKRGMLKHISNWFAEKPARWRVPAAAAMVLLAGSYLVFHLTFRNNVPLSSKLSAPQTKDISPGGNHAVLLLAGGNRIILGNRPAGLLAREGGTEIIGADSGSIRYRLMGQTPGHEDSLPRGLNTLATPRGGQFRLVLPDGTRVWLNAASSLSYPVQFWGPERRVVLKGEAYFEVAANPSLPFRVQISGRSELEVKGTHFNVMAYPDEPALVTTLLEGLVAVRPAGSTRSPVLIHPNEQAIVRDSLHGVEVRKDPEAAEAVAWKNGITSFSDADIRTIMRKVARWYDVEVSYSGEMPSRRFEGGIPRNANLSEVLKVLSLYKIHYSLSGKHILISP